MGEGESVFFFYKSRISGNRGKSIRRASLSTEALSKAAACSKTTAHTERRVGYTKDGVFFPSEHATTHQGSWSNNQTMPLPWAGVSLVHCVLVSAGIARESSCCRSRARKTAGTGREERLHHRSSMSKIRLQRTKFRADSDTVIFGCLLDSEQNRERARWGLLRCLAPSQINTRRRPV